MFTVQGREVSVANDGLWNNIADLDWDHRSFFGEFTVS